MKKSILLLAFFNIVLSGHAQFIRGTVFDRETKNPISFAVAFFDGTSVATYTDDKGSFKLEIKKNSSMPLTISALGYYSEITSELSANKEILVYLTPKVFEIEEVNVNARGNPNIRKQNLEIFRKEFLGKTPNAKECEIINEDDIRFISSPDNDTLRAYSLKPIIINNKGLGYKITYYLNKFEHIKSKYKLQVIGYSLFEEVSNSPSEKQYFETRRNNTYYGSKMHFIRSLWQNDLKKEGYTVKNLKNELFYKDLVRTQLSTDPGQTKKIIYYPVSMPITLSIKWNPGKALSGLEILRNNIYIDENGYYKGPGFVWQGEMAKQGAADRLPYDFEPLETATDESITNNKLADYLSAGSYNELAAQSTEKVYLQTDRDIYYSGDDIWFKSYLVDGFTHILTDSSKNLHVELISPYSKIIDRKIIRLENGLGKGDFTLHESIRSGNYQLRAYTNYMRNFGDQLFFVKEITLINSSDTTKNIDNNRTTKDNGMEISFFPEGGSLVENVPSIVAFKAVDSNGSGCNVSGEVYSSGGELITSFSSTHLGMGTFSLTPGAGIKYYATIKNPDGSVIKQDIPESFSSGFVLNAQVNESGGHLITLKTNPETLRRYLGGELLVTVSSHKKNLKGFIVKPETLQSRFILKTQDLPEGIVMITLFDQDSQPLCERLIFIRNTEEISVKVETDKKVYNQRDSVLVNISLIDTYRPEQEAYLSLSATEKIFTDGTSPFSSNISSWFLLESDVRGQVENPSLYFDPLNSNREREMDLLLLTQGWRDFEWKYKEETYRVETGFTISGVFRRLIPVAGIKNTTINIGVFQGENKILTSAPVDSTGRFRIDFENLTGSADIVVTATDNKGRFKGKLILDSFNYSPPEVLQRPGRAILLFNENLSGNENLTFLKQSDAIKKSIKKKYTLSDTIMIDEVQIIARKKEELRTIHLNQGRMLYGTPDKEVIITPQLATIGSIRVLLTGRVAGIISTTPSSKDDSGIRIRGSGSLLGSSEPLFLLDGIVVTYSELSSIPLNWIDRVDVIKSWKAAGFGIRGANGVISVITKSVEDIQFKPVSYSVNSKISGYDAPRIFYSPKHSSSIQPEYLPDLRSTLYWFPDIDITTNKDYAVAFYNSDISSIYTIIIEGITSYGIPVTGKVEFEVK